MGFNSTSSEIDMLLGWNFEEMECYSAVMCADYDYSMFSKFMVTVRYYSAFITMLIYGVNFWYRDLYHLFLGLGVWMNYGINSLIFIVANQQVPIELCKGPYGMPAYLTQTAFFFSFMVLSYYATWPISIYPTSAAFLSFLPLLVAVSEVSLGYNTLEQVIVGAWVGCGFALIYHMVLYTIVYPRVTRIASLRVALAMGYVNTLMKYDTYNTNKRTA